MSLKEKYTGSGVAMVTPFSNDGAIDFAVLENHTDELIKHGIDYLVVLGTTAETPTLSKKEKIAQLHAREHYNWEKIVKKTIDCIYCPTYEKDLNLFTIFFLIE